jgi:hypothetical protein
MSIGIFIAISLMISGCTPAAAPTPTAIPPSPTPIPPTPTPDPLAIVKAYEEALSLQDFDATMALFTDQPKFQWGGWTTGVNKQDISNLHSYFLEVHEEIENTDCKAEGIEVTCQAVFRDDCTEAAGMDGERYASVVYQIENGKITKVTTIELIEDSIKLGYFYTIMLNWAAKNQPEERQKLFDPHNTFLWNQDSGKIMSKFCQEYATIKP